MGNRFSACSIFIFICMFMTSVFGARPQKLDVVKDIDLNQFSGTWYEIARLPNQHEKGLVEVTSTFKRTDDGEFLIENRGYKGSRDGKCMTVKGKIVIPDHNENGAMKVKIWWLSIDYRVIDVDKENYQYALIATDSKKYLWIISKQPVMDPIEFDNLLSVARENGFNVGKLEKVQQNYNIAIARR